MSGLELGWAAAFVAGLLSFLSPCVAPLVPGYLGFLAGGAGVGSASASARGETERLLTASLLFVLGFSAVFVALGASAAFLGGLIETYRPQLTMLGGLLMVLMGLVIVGLVRWPAFYRERRFHLIDRPYGPLGTVLLGMAFAFGWTPCVGPMLAAILFHAGAAETVEQGAALLLVYSLGLGVPFVLVGLGYGRALGLLGWARRHAGALNLASGVLLVGFGLLFLSGRAFHLSLLAQRLFYALAPR